MAAAVTPARSGGGVSPSSSPRLPSPPPMPELQFGPQSPLSGSANEAQVDASNRPDEAARRRIRPGTKAGDMASGPPLVPLNQVDSAFPLQEHLKALYAQLTHGQNSTHTMPITKDSALQIARPPQLEDGESADRNLWLYEICRFLTVKAGTGQHARLQTCPEMRASEWQYLCAVHEPPKSCCAIDYVNHTLDWAANVLTSTKHFPSRLQLGAGEQGSAYQSMRQLTNIFRRVYRIFAHAWFQHQEVFWHIESTQGIYILFKTVCDEYHLIPEDNYTIPPEAEGPREETETDINPTPTEANPLPTSMQILRKNTAIPVASDNVTDPSSTSSPSKDLIPAQTARRHRHTPSTGSHVTTIAEGTEEDDVPPVPPIPSPASTTSQSASEATLPSPDRKVREALGRLDMSGTSLPTKTNADGSGPPQPENPTPRTTQVADPLAAAGAEQTPTDATAAGSGSIAQSVKLDTAAATAPKSMTEQDRRESGFESEIRSPGGGSVRTAGPDLLCAILGHIDDKEREEVLAGERDAVVKAMDERQTISTESERETDGEGEGDRKKDEEASKEEDGEETVLFVGGGAGGEEKGNGNGTAADDGAEKAGAADADAEVKGTGEEDEEDDDSDNETMEEIQLSGSQTGTNDDEGARPRRSISSMSKVT